MERDGSVSDSARPTFEELHRARPARGQGAPARCASHKSAILALLRERGPQGVLGSELYDSPEKFGRSPRNRVAELRAEGHLIEGRPHSPSDWFYRLIRDNTGAKPLSDLPDPPAGQIPLSDYMQKVHKEQAAAMPLFAGSKL
jgi:hypothetical protein